MYDLAKFVWTKLPMMVPPLHRTAKFDAHYGSCVIAVERGPSDMAEQFRVKYSLRRLAKARAAGACRGHRLRDVRRPRRTIDRTTELDALIGLIDHYEDWFGLTPLSLAVVTLDDTSEVRLARLLRRAIGRGRPLSRHVFERYTEPACAVS